MVAATSSALYQQTIITELSQEAGLDCILATAVWMTLLIYFPQMISESPIENVLCNPRAEIEPLTLFEVEFQNVNFAYPGSGFQIHNLSLSVGRGQKIAIVGENGGGKTTLTKLLLRLYDVDEGKILINGKDIREYDVQKLRSCIGVAFQETHVYAVSMRDNLMLYTDEADWQQMEAVCRLFGLDKVLEKVGANIMEKLQSRELMKS